MDKLIPFLLMGVGPDGMKQYRANWSRISELAIAIITILYFMNTSVMKMEVKLDSVQSEIREIKSRIALVDDRVYEHMREKR